MISSDDTNKYLLENIDFVFEPEDDHHKETLVFLHGLGDKASNFCKFFKMVEEARPYLPTTRVIFVNAPQNTVKCNSNMKTNSWFDILQLRENMDVNLEEKGLKELKQSTARLTNVIEEEIQIIGDSKKVFIGGLSQGCATSLYVGTGFKKPLGGILGFIGWVVPVTEFSEENKDIPIFLGHGKLDPLVPFEIADKTYDTLKGGQVTRYVDPEGDHWITLMMAIKAREWLLDICSKQNAKTDS